MDFACVCVCDFATEQQYRVAEVENVRVQGHRWQAINVCQSMYHHNYLISQPIGLGILGERERARIGKGWKKYLEISRLNDIYHRLAGGAFRWICARGGQQRIHARHFGCQFILLTYKSRLHSPIGINRSWR